jgi:3-(3-hydroxy-phenyl)propionate hydroxylase
MAEQDLAQLSPTPDWQDPIVIVGAGPVGLTAALGLTFYGVPCVVLDNDVGPAIEGSRAIFFERNTIEILGAWSSVGQQMAEEGMTLTSGRVFFGEKELYKTFSAPPDPEKRFPRFVNFHQNRLEALLYQALQARKNCQVLWQHKVTGVTQNGQSVRLEVETPDGVKHIDAPYVIAADGPRSSMRRFLQLNFPGESREHHFLIVDVRTQMETPRERWFWFDPPFNRGYTALMHPTPEGVYRIDYQLPSDADLEAVKAPEHVHKLLVATIGNRPYEVVWKTIYTYHQRALEHFKVGRVVFVGDAAHLMSVFGGRGLNSGVQDAANLVWKLVLVRAGLAPERLLETYDDERQAAALENLRLTASTMRFLVPPKGLPRWRRDAILRSSLFFPFMRRYVNAGHMSNPYTYRGSPICSEQAQLHLSFQDGATTPEQRAVLRRFQKGPLAGELAPEVVLVDGTTGERVSTQDLFWHSFVVLYFCADPDIGIHALQRVRSALPQVPMTLCVISPHVPVKSPPEGIKLLLDREGKGVTAYSAGSRTLYLVRPDKHIAARRFTCDLSELPGLLECAIGRTPNGANQAHEQAAPDRSRMDSLAARNNVL